MRTLLFCLATLAAVGQTLPNAVTSPNPELQFVDSLGHPLAGGKLCTYAAGSTTPQATYTDSTAGTPNANPVILDINGRAAVWVGPLLYKYVLRTGGDGTCSTGIVVFSADNIADTTAYFVNFVKTAGTATLITYTDPLTGSIARTVSSRLADIPSLLDFGGACDGSTDNTAAMNLAIAAAPASLLIPVGTCVLASSETIPSGMQLIFEGKISMSAGKVLTINSGIIASPTSQIFTGAGTEAFGDGAVASAQAAWFPGTDCGAQINEAYAALPSVGGIIDISRSCTFATAISFSTNNKPVILRGQGDATDLTFSGSGVAVTLNYGTGLRVGHGIRDLTLTGPGNGTSTTGVIAGGSNGAQGYDIRDVKIQSFGINFQLGSNTWIGTVTQSMIRDGGTNVLFPSGLSQAGENMQFNHVTFADAPSPHTNSVNIQGTGQEVDFTDCSFDQAQLHLGNTSTSAVQVNMKGTHFENPNFASGVDYPFIVMDNNNGNYLSMSQTFVEEDRSSGAAYASFFNFNGGKVNIMGLGMFSPIQVTAVATLANAVNVDLFSFNDLSGNTVALLGGSTSGFVTSFPGANTASTSGFNALLTIADPVGGDKLDVAGNIRAKAAQLVSTISTGSAPAVINSTTPVANLFGQVLAYSPGGTQSTTATHVVYGSVASTTVVTLSGAAAYTNSGSYNCSGVGFTPTSGTSFSFTGAGTTSYVCVGN